MSGLDSIPQADSPVAGMPMLLQKSGRSLVSFLLWAAQPLIRIGRKTEFPETWRDPLIIVFNHNNSIEVLFAGIMVLLKRRCSPISFLVDWMYGRIPFLSHLFRAVDPIYVYGKPARWRRLAGKTDTENGEKVIGQCLSKLKNRRSLALFPEGTRNRDPLRLKRGRLGIGYLALLSQVDILPIGITYRSRTHPHRIPPWKIPVFQIGERMSFSEETDCFFHSAMNHPPYLRGKILHYLSSRVTYKVMKQLSMLSGKDYPFPGPAMPAEWKSLCSETEPRSLDETKTSGYESQ